MQTTLRWDTARENVKNCVGRRRRIKGNIFTLVCPISFKFCTLLLWYIGSVMTYGFYCISISLGINSIIVLFPLILFQGTSLAISYSSVPSGRVISIRHQRYQSKCSTKHQLEKLYDIIWNVRLVLKFVCIFAEKRRTKSIYALQSKKNVSNALILS